MKSFVRDSLNNTGLPLIQLEILHKRHWFVVDTGSNANLLSSELKEELEANHKSVGSSFTSGIGGNTEKGELFIVPYILDDYIFSDCFMTVSAATFQAFENSGVKVSGLLGTPFLLFHRCLVDYSEGAVYLSGQKDEVRLVMRKTPQFQLANSD